MINLVSIAAMFVAFLQLWQLHSVLSGCFVERARSGLLSGCVCDAVVERPMRSLTARLRQSTVLHWTEKAAGSHMWVTAQSTGKRSLFPGSRTQGHTQSQSRTPGQNGGGYEARQQWTVSAHRGERFGEWKRFAEWLVASTHQARTRSY